MGIKNAAIHYHFPSKSDLVAAVINHHIESFNRFKKEQKNKKTIQKVSAFLDIYSKIQAEERICVVGSLATDWDTIDETSQKLLKEAADDILQWLTTTLAEGLKNKEFQFEETPRTKALLIITNMLAATQLARITSGKDFTTIRAAILKSLKV